MKKKSNKRGRPKKHPPRTVKQWIRENMGVFSPFFVFLVKIIPEFHDHINQINEKDLFSRF